jgi:hypothetical protein
MIVTTPITNNASTNAIIATAPPHVPAASMVHRRRSPDQPGGL